MWQIWNEPNLSLYWPQPFASSYVPLLRAAHDAIKRADPGAKVVLGALTNVAWTALGQIYASRRAHACSTSSRSTASPRRRPTCIVFLRLVRRAMDRFRRPAQAAARHRDELALGPRQTPRSDFDWDTTEAGQARNIAALLPMLGADRASRWACRASTTTPGWASRTSGAATSTSPVWSGSRTDGQVVDQAGPGRVQTRRADARALQGEVLGGHPLRQALSCRRPALSASQGSPHRGTGQSGPPRTGPPVDRPPTRSRRRSDRPCSGG